LIRFYNELMLGVRASIVLLPFQRLANWVLSRGPVIRSSAPICKQARAAYSAGVNSKPNKFAKSLEDKKYLVREVRQANTNRFHLTKLMAALVRLKKGI
jgi:hypothetical protein